MPDALLTGLSALSAQQRAMQVTSHNLANATTEGFTRQRVDLQASSPEDIRPGQFGRGVDLVAVRRIMDDLVNERLRQVEGEGGRLTALKQNLLVVQQAFNEPGETGLSATIGRLFSSMQDLSNNPESVAIRATAVQEMNTFTATIADLGQRLRQVREDLQVSLTSSVSAINDITSSIARLNQSIRSQVNLGNSPNDLLDQRDRALGELTKLLDVSVRTNPADQSVTVSLGGRLLVSSDRADTLQVATTGDGDLSVVGSGGIGYELAGGSAGAIYDLNRRLMPAIAQQIDTMAATVALEINAIHAVGTSNSHTANSFTGDFTVPSLASGANLDSATVTKTVAGAPGIPELFLPSFSDASGATVVRNLTMNVYDPVTKSAVKSVLRFDPAQGNGSRSLDDLVAAINTGVGGGWSVYPPTANGVEGVRAQKVQVDGGFRLEIKAVSPTAAVDFSQALDLAPASKAWAGTGSVSVSGTAAPALPTRRLSLEVNAAGTAVTMNYRNPIDGSTVALGSVAIPGVGSTVAVINGISVTVAAGAYRAGDRSAVQLDVGGTVLDAAGVPGTASIAPSWTIGDATMQVSGRYTNTLSDPTRPWSMQVVTGGVIGAKSSLAPPNNPPTVTFTYWTGSPAAPVQQVVTKTLDDSLPAGTPIALADGVYVTFGGGNLSTAGNRLQFTVDGDPDQARLLPALGLNSLFTGGDSASTLAVSARILKDPAQLDVARTRNEGDNAGVNDMLTLRKQKLFGNQSFTLDDFYQGVVTDIGVRIQQAERLGANQDALKASLANQREQLSGVNIDEEVGRMIQQQQAYQAAARVVTFARENIQSLLEILR